MATKRTWRLDNEPPPKMVSHGMIWFNEELPEEQPDRYKQYEDMNFARISRWQRQKEHNQMLKYNDKAKIRDMTNAQIEKGLYEAVQEEC